MFALSLSTFRERWQLFIGAIVTVVLGVALVQSSLLILLSATSYVEAITLLGMTLFLAAFLAVFIVSSTFAFTIAQRRRDLALLRLVGGGRGQLRRLLLSEALLLGLVGTALGVPLGLVTMRVQSWLLTDLGFLPDAFSPQWRAWIVAVAAGVGIGVSQLGVLAASRRASRVRPLEALRETGAATRVMTGPRWAVGLLFLAGAVALAILSQLGGPEMAIPMSMNVALTAAVALSALSPLVVPMAGRLFGLVLGRTPLGGLARANLRDGVRRSSSTAAPLLVLVALVVGMSASMSTLAEAGKRELADDVRADFVVSSTVGPLPAVASTEHVVPVTVVTTSDDEEDLDSDSALAVDEAAYQQVHHRGPVSGSLADLHGLAVAGPGLELGETLRMRIGGTEVRPRVVAVLPESYGGGASYLLPRELVPPRALAQAPVRTIVQVPPGTDPAVVEAALPQPVSTVEEWRASAASEQYATNRGIMLVLMGLAGLYSLVAVINAVVIAAAERKSEFAAARVTGLDRRQVVRMALLEAEIVAGSGVLLGLLAAAGSAAGIGGAVGLVSVPWAVIGVVAAGALLVVGATSVWTTLSATRTAPVRLVGARE
ncbi:putative ABC transport system permease protein [Amycolatopsis sacchari]|uniref:Putative ABC transport system permease protein n=1 Tax=Amycolatopsis sacchari TaxID=115433 RepID=A0A1I3YR99_9PSEU|nr:FtsX-like permease family protein [Amycolatopsis sacchari]SFK34315.1 putative ABC transport system permease protein [Amycolatopsis sacchari]